MKKISTLIMAAAATFALCACGTDDWHDPYDPYDRNDWYVPDGNNRGDGGGFDNDRLSDELTQTEQGLVGSYVSDDGQEPVIYLTLSNNRSGYYTTNGTSCTFSWYVDGSNLYMLYSNNDGEYYPITYDGSNRLCLNGIPFVATKSDNNGQASNDVLVGQWQGKFADQFYTDMYGFETADNLTSILEFASDGTGAQLDCDKYSPTENYSVITFNWVRNGSTLSISYHDNDKLWTSASIDGSIATSSSFTGKVSYSGFAQYNFAYTKVSGFDWTPYLGYTSEAKATRGGKALSQMQALRMAKGGSESHGSFKK